MRGFVSFEVPLRHSVLVTMRTLHATLNPHSRPHYYRSCRCRLLHAGRQRAQSCVDENEPWSSTDLHVGMAAARPSQEELQFCLAAAQQPRPHGSSVRQPTREFAEVGLAPSTSATAQLQLSHRHADLDGSMSLAMAGAEVRPLHVVHGAGAEVHGRGNDCALGGASRCGCAERR